MSSFTLLLVLVIVYYHRIAVLCFSYHIICFTYTFHFLLYFMLEKTLEVDKGNYKGPKALYSLCETIVYKGPKALLSLCKTMTIYKGSKAMLSLYEIMTIYKGPKVLLSLYETMTIYKGLKAL